jgi:Holliday junction resolvase RusA-like endonuclease
MIRIVIRGINPEPWATGTIVTYKGGKGGKLSPDLKLVTYQQAVREEIREWMEQHPTQRVNLMWSQEVRFFFVRSTERGHPADATNLQKATEDALQNLLIENDRNNRKVTSEIIEQHKDVQFPGIIIEIEDYEFDPQRHEDIMQELIPPNVSAFADSTYEPPTEDYI